MDLAELAMMLESVNATEVSVEEFESAATKLSQTKGLSNDQKLQFYGLYKQATIGDVNTSQPWSINMVAKAKWDAWKNFEGFPIKSAQIAYVFLVNQLDQEILLQNQSNDDEKPSAEENVMSVAVSSFAAPLVNENVTEEWTDSEKGIFNAVTTGDIEAVKQMLESGLDVSLKDSEGMTPLHFATDRGHLEIVKILLQSGASVDDLNSDGQTPLMIALTCEHAEIITELLNAGASLDIRDSDGVTIQEMIEESSPEIRVLFEK